MRDLYFKYMSIGEELIKDNLGKLIQGNYTSKPQPADGASIVYQSDYDYKPIEINLRHSSYEIHNSIRAFIFEEFQLPVIAGYEIKKSILTNKKKERKIIEIKDGYIEITGADGYVIEAYFDVNKI